MEFLATNLEVILNDPLLSFVLDQCVLSPMPWVVFDQLSVDRNSFLHTLAVLRGVTKDLRLQAGLTVQLAALRLASYDAERTSVKVTQATKDETLLQLFDANYNIFSSSWTLQIDIPSNLRTIGLDDLHPAELHELCQILQTGWSLKTNLCKGGGQGDALNVWVTPLNR